MNDTTVTEKPITHTPGPWRWFDYADGRKLLAAGDRAVLHCPYAPIGCTPADAALIAAAPDLLDALRDFVRLYDTLRDAIGDTMLARLTRADAALAKADGSRLVVIGGAR